MPAYRSAGSAAPLPLRRAELDAEELVELLIARSEFARKSVVLLTGPKATRKGIRAAFLEAAAKLHPGDRFVFHFSGHGTRIIDRKRTAA